MKKLFYFGIIFLTLFEIFNVYFIMPMPGSQMGENINLAYFLYSYRWIFRILLGLVALSGLKSAFLIKWKWVPVIPILIWIVITYLFNFKMTADHMFLQPQSLSFAGKAENKLDSNAILIGIEISGEAKAYPMRYLIYHHQAVDMIGGKEVIVTYCSVCRTAAAFEPKVEGKSEKFRLVGMDHFNAMFEDNTTHSWWRQVNGEAIAGELKGKTLPLVHSIQVSAKKWFELYPNGKIMQLDEASKDKVDLVGRYETGNARSALTKSDTGSWNNKSWVVGISIGSKSKAYDWNELKRKKVINDKIGSTLIAIILSSDEKSFMAFERNSNELISLKNDTILCNENKYSLLGKSINKTSKDLKAIQASQEFWHSWKYFYPNTEK